MSSLSGLRQRDDALDAVQDHLPDAVLARDAAAIDEIATLYDEASLRWLMHDEPDLREVRSGIERILSEVRRASDVILRIRALSRKSEPELRSIRRSPACSSRASSTATSAS